MKCCICHGEIDVKKDAYGNDYWDKGDNALPVKEGRCCTLCNATIVVPTRVRQILNRDKETANDTNG